MSRIKFSDTIHFLANLILQMWQQLTFDVDHANTILVMMASSSFLKRRMKRRSLSTTKVSNPQVPGSMEKISEGRMGEGFDAFQLFCPDGKKCFLQQPE